MASPLRAIAPALLLASLTVTPAIAQDEVIELPEGFTKKMAAKVTEVIDAVHPVRQLGAAEDVEYRVIDNEAFLVELRALFEEEYPDEYVVAEDALYTRLGLIEPDQDLKKLILKIYDQQVLAYYDPATTTFTLIGPTKSIGPFESVVVAHEYGHALQDAKWDLDTWMIDDLSQSDAILAQQALVEGDATAVMYDWTARELNLWQLISVAARALSDQDARRLDRLPDILQRQLEFPYIDGFIFVNAIRGRGDWAAVNDVWENPPVSTEQILHPELYPDELPVDIVLPDIAALLGPEWVASYEQTMGEMQTHVWLSDQRDGVAPWPALPEQLPRDAAAAGWGGDRLVSLDGPNGAWAVVWQTAWDSQNDQKEFRSTAKKVMKDLPGAHSARNADVVGGLSSPVLVLVADSDTTMATLEDALGL